MAEIDKKSTESVITSMLDRMGGDLHLFNKTGVNSFNGWVTSTNIPADYKPFIISIFDTELREDIVSLVMMINPRDLNISQAQVVSTANTRSGWVNTLWGNQQATIAASGLSAGFYYFTVNGDGSGGITNFHRKNSAAYLNLLSVVSLFKNNACYYMDAQENPTFFNDGTSRVINVMDIIHISYDGSDYLGSFNSFNLTDAAASPFRMEYSFEFSVSIFGSDPNTIDGHVKRGGNENSNKIVLGVQGKNTDFSEVIIMDKAKLNEYFSSEAASREIAEEKDRSTEVASYGMSASGTWDDPEKKKELTQIPANTILITQGWRDVQEHPGGGGKIDYRTASGEARSLTEGVIVSVRGPSPGGPNYVIVASKKEDGQTVYARYYHLDPKSMVGLSVNKPVAVGDLLGREGTDGGIFPQHIDLGVSTSLVGDNLDFSKMVDASPVMEDGTRKLKALADSNPTNPAYADYKKKPIFKGGEKKPVSETLSN